MKSSNFTFDAKQHCYTLDGELLPGVTTVLSTLAKPALIQWAANMACDYVSENRERFGDSGYPDTGASFSDGNLDEVLKEAKTAYAKKRDKASEQGTDIHSEIEGVIKKWIEQNSGWPTDMATNLYTDQTQKFITWASDNNVQFHESEKRLYSPTHKFAGTVDFTCTMDGKRLVGDIKTTSGIYDLSPFLQVAAYRICLEEMGEAPYQGGVIIRLGKDGSFDEHYRYDAGDDMDTFLALLKVYKALAKYKNQK